MTSPVASLTEALIAANDALLGFFDIGEASASSLEVDEVVPRVLERVAKLVDADAIQLSVSDTTFSVGPPQLYPHLHSSMLWLRTDRGAFHTTTAVARHGSGLDGEVRAGRYGEEFNTGDRKILAAGLRIALSAVENCRLHIETVHAAVEAREREHAAKIAQLALPVEQPTIAGLDIHFENRQVHGTGGDLVCFHGDNTSFRFAVGDVAGKGLPAAVIMATAATATNAALRDPFMREPGEQLRRINEWLFEHLAAAELFLTLFVGAVRADDGIVRWANAGHSPCLITGPDRAMDLAPTSPPLGVLRPITSDTRSTTLGEADTLFVGSDGIVEQTGPRDAMFGETRLRHALAAPTSAAAAARQLEDELAAYTRNARQQDDQTMVIIRRAVSQ